MCVAYDIVNVREQSGTGALSVPESIELRAVPLYELYGNSDLYGAFYYIILYQSQSRREFPKTSSGMETSLVTS
jgi:hypothetical protein